MRTVCAKYFVSFRGLLRTPGKSPLVWFPPHKSHSSPCITFSRALKTLISQSSSSFSTHVSSPTTLSPTKVESLPRRGLKVNFPGAPSSEFTYEMEFLEHHPIISTYRVMSPEGEILHASHDPKV